MIQSASMRNDFKRLRVKYSNSTVKHSQDNSMGAVSPATATTNSIFHHYKLHTNCRFLSVCLFTNYRQRAQLFKLYTKFQMRSVVDKKAEQHELIKAYRITHNLG